MTDGPIVVQPTEANRVAGPAGSVLAIEGVTVNFGGVIALRDVSFAINPGEVVAIVGPNGAGKTTLLNAICGVLAKNRKGQISIDGRSSTRMSPSAVARLGVGRSFQDPRLIEEATVLENVLLGAHLSLRYRMADQIFRRRYVRKREDEATVEAMQVLDAAGLTEHAHDVIAGLPYGARKIVDVARAMLCGRRLLFLDEPTSGLDGGEQAVVAKIISQFCGETDRSILMVEHHMDLVRRTADRVVGLQAGSILALGTPSEVLDSEAFREAVVGDGDVRRTWP